MANEFAKDLLKLLKIDDNPYMNKPQPLDLDDTIRCTLYDYSIRRQRRDEVTSLALACYNMASAEGVLDEMTTGISDTFNEILEDDEYDDNHDKIPPVYKEIFMKIEEVADRMHELDVRFMPLIYPCMLKLMTENSPAGMTEEDIKNVKEIDDTFTEISINDFDRSLLTMKASDYMSIIVLFGDGYLCHPHHLQEI